MGIIRKLKQIFNKNIDCCREIDDNIVCLHKKKYLYINKNIIVPEKTACVIVYKYKVSDVIFAGKYRINVDTMPEIFSRAKIERKEKLGNKVNKIRADIYYVNLNEKISFPFESDTPFKARSSELGRVVGFLQGVCDLKVIDPGSIVKSLIFETGKEKTKDVIKDVGLWVGNRINKSIEKNKIPANMMFSNCEYVESVVNTDMQDALDKLGLFVSNVQLKAIDFPKRYQAKVNKYMSTHKRTISPYDINLSNLGVNTNNQRLENNGAGVYVARGITSEKQMSADKICPVCGARVSFGSRFCGKCGSRL